MAGQARDLPMIAGYESPLIITARACLVPLRPTGAGPNGTPTRRKVVGPSVGLTNVKLCLQLAKLA
jgi:hypothetical protein